MARVQLIIPDEDRERFVYQARLEGMTLSGWLRAAAEEKLKRKDLLKPFRSSDEVREFFLARNRSESEVPEPNWEEHLKTLHDAKMSAAQMP